MPKTYKSKAIFLLLFLVLLFMTQETSAQKRRSKSSKKPAAAVEIVPPQIAYTVSMSKPWTHLLEIEMRVKWEQMPAKTELKMPVWTPGSYLIREYARHVQKFVVNDGAGTALTWKKINKNTWQIDTGKAKEFVASYLVYSNELTVRTNELNDEHAFWNNAAALLFIKDQISTASTVKVDPYGKWKIATGLPASGGQLNTFRADNYDQLYDSPFEVSDFKEASFDVEGKRHRIVVSGEGNYDLDRLAVDLAKIVEESFKIFGEIDYDNYTFIVNLRGGGGLEHLNSTALQYDRFGFKSDAGYNGFLRLAAHEYFHNYNVKRIRPDGLGPFDYENENYTRLLWLAEGGTEYYATLLLLRTGLMSADDFLKGKADSIQQLQEQPGRFEISLEDASFDAWIKYYRQDENAVNNQISYYDKGEIVTMMLDIAIRTASAGTRSLDDVMRQLYTEYFKRGKNITPADLQQVSELIAGRSLDDFFSKYIRGTEDIDYSSILKGIGLDLTETLRGKGSGYIGANMADNNGRLVIRVVPAGTPAYEQGLNTGDQIIAIDGYRANLSFLRSYIGEKKPNDKVKLTIFRYDKLREVTFTLGSDVRKDYEFSSVVEPSDEQKKLLNQYLGTDH